jgi:hypothetical protein
MYPAIDIHLRLDHDGAVHRPGLATLPRLDRPADRSRRP